jgi:hypothetical protein
MKNKRMSAYLILGVYFDWRVKPNSFAAFDKSSGDTILNYFKIEPSPFLLVTQYLITLK